MAEHGLYGKSKEVRPRMWVAFAGFLCTLGILIVISTLAQRSVASSPGLARGLSGSKPNFTMLWALIVASLAYSAWSVYVRTLTGMALLDGSIGVALGLFICAHPAANAVNLLFFERDLLQGLSKPSVLGWLALNLVVLLAGWLVIFISLLRLMEQPL